jgi:hypothetical protein
MDRTLTHIQTVYSFLERVHPLTLALRYVCRHPTLFKFATATLKVEDLILKAACKATFTAQTKIALGSLTDKGMNKMSGKHATVV